MQPKTIAKSSEALTDASTNDRKADEITLRKFFAAVGKKFRAIFSARHAPDIAHEDAVEDVLGEQVILPSAFVKEASAFIPKDGRG